MTAIGLATAKSGAVEQAITKKKGGITATVTEQGELDAGNSDLCFCVRLLHQSWQASNSRYDAEDKL